MAKKKKHRKPTKIMRKPKPWKKVFGIIAAVVTFISSFVTIMAFVHPRENTDNIIHNNLGMNFYVNYEYGENVSDLSQASENYNQGLEYFRMSDYDNALIRYNEALDEYENKPVTVDKARIQYAIGLLYKRKGNLKEAIQWYTDAVGTLNSFKEKSSEIYNELCYVHYLRGSAYLNNRDLERAILDCRDCFTFLN